MMNCALAAARSTRLQIAAISAWGGVETKKFEEKILACF
jgi:hypothetical protein